MSMLYFSGIKHLKLTAATSDYILKRHTPITLNTIMMRVCVRLLLIVTFVNIVPVRVHHAVPKIVCLIVIYTQKRLY